MIAVFVILAVMSVPLAAIASRTWLKTRELHARQAGDVHLRLLEREVRDLRARVEVLETIATSGGPERVIVEPYPELAAERVSARALART